MNLEVNERPLVTFALFAYNQERFIRDALESAFSQTYSPLEIVLSDDCSQDATYSIMQQMASGYQGGHKVVLNRNPRNLGVAAHVNAVMNLSRGLLIVAAAGDDIAFPDRVEQTVKVWSKNQFRADSIALGIEPFADNFSGSLRAVSPVLTSKEEVIWNAGPRVIGAAHAWTRRLFDVFGPLPEWLHEEDVVLPFRALFLGGIAFEPIPVVRYRQHRDNTLSGANPAFKGLRGQELRYQMKLKKSLRALEGMALTVNQAVALGLISLEEGATLQNLIRESKQRRQVELDLTSSDFKKRLHAGFMIWLTKTVRHYSVLRKLFLSASALLPQLRTLEWKVRDRGR
ncbi:MAG: glycosyltransferase [Verrucomicrobiae bacterium]|nr:glycosyltransferase [Verrucomicrobiae bacterium]